ncbi:MAG: hypothetical protein CVU55_04340 [Deltaproteobacteria bacterium HGW-Deltaproteobacteria-13]|jgi:hypothetical protein|nr:MAG: hypothetical protein CVU55_04340 [Deltaproteobacteria bacterium HGW-Deltaproteobacteria-13]
MNFSGWDIKQLRNWLQKSSTQEDDSFDLKEKIPDDEEGKIRLKREFCGFANQKGGFLLFGVDKKKRIVGVEKNDEFVTRLGQIINTHVTPATIKFDIHECIKLKSKRTYVYIIEIQESPLGEKPHVFFKEGKGLSIPLRTNGSLRDLKRGDEIRKLCLSQSVFYPEYGRHVIEILKNIKGQHEPYFTLWETTICQGFKTYYRSIDTEKSKEFVLTLEDIEKKISNLKKAIIIASTEGGEPTGIQDKEQLERAIDSFIDKYQTVII